MTHWGSRYQGRSEGSLAAQEQWQRDGRRTAAFVVVVAVLTALVLLASGCTLLDGSTDLTVSHPQCGEWSYSSPKDQVAPFARCSVSGDSVELQIGSDSAVNTQARTIEALGNVITGLVPTPVGPMVP